MIITDSVKKEIVNNILNAKDKRKQVGIEADLHCISKGVVKDILKEEGYSLRILNGGNFAKKHIEDKLAEETPQVENEAKQEDYREETYTEEDLAKQWGDLAIPPISDEESQDIITPVDKIPYKKPEIIEPPLPKSSEPEEDAADSPSSGEYASADDVLFIGTHILDEDEIIVAFKKKVDELIERRRAHVAEIELIDAHLKKYAHFYEDLYSDLEKEGVEI